MIVVWIVICLCENTNYYPYAENCELQFANFFILILVYKYANNCYQLKKKKETTFKLIVIILKKIYIYTIVFTPFSRVKTFSRKCQFSWIPKLDYIFSF